MKKHTYKNIKVIHKYLPSNTQKNILQSKQVFFRNISLFFKGLFYIFNLKIETSLLRLKKGNVKK